MKVDAIGTRVEKLDARFDKVDAQLKEINVRFDRVEALIGKLIEQSKPAVKP